MYFFEDGYCGVQPVAADVVNACAMVRSDCATSLDEVFALHPKLAERAAGWHAVMQPISTAPLVYREPQPVRGNMMFVGDAAAFIDPFAGDGISIALRSGRVAAECLREFLLARNSLVECSCRVPARVRQAIRSADLSRSASSFAVFAARNCQAGRLRIAAAARVGPVPDSEDEREG